MIYYVNGVTERVGQHAYSLAIEAEDEEEARDLAYEILSTYPDNDLVAQRLLKVDEEFGPVTRVELQMAEEAEDEEADEPA